MRSKYVSVTAPYLTVIGVLVLWQLLTCWGIWNEHVLPGPINVGISLWELAISGVMLKHSVASLFRVTVGFYLAVLLGVPAGIAMGRLTLFHRFMNPLIQFLRPISPLAWIPLAMLWFGIGDKPAVFLIFISSFFPIVISTTVAVRSVKPFFFYVAANFKFSWFEVITHIIFPAILPNVITALRVSMGIAWVVVVAAEMIAVKSGLGYLIIDSRNALRTDYVIAGMILIGVIGLGLDSVMKRLSHFKFLKWHSIE